MDFALIVTGLVSGVSILVGFFISFWLGYRKQKQVLSAMSELSEQARSGLVVFDVDGRILHKDAYAAFCLPFLEQEHMQDAGLAECLEYLSLQARLAQPKLGAGALERMSVLPAGEFQEIIGVPDGRFCLVRVQALDDGTKILVLSDYDAVYGGASLHRLLQHEKGEALSDLAAGVTHNFNNTLLVAGSHARLLLAKLGDQQDDENVHLQRIIAACEKAARSNINLMSTFACPVELNDVVDLSEFLDADHLPLCYQAPPHIHLKVDTKLDGAYVRSSGDILMCVIDLFLQNAAAEMKDGGEISVSLDRVYKDDAMLRISIKDEAALMTLSEQQRVFDPFSSVRQPDDMKGLGLSLGHGLVQQLGGYIEVSAADGKGNQFDIYLPQSADMPSKSVEGTIIDLDNFKLHGYQILVVDDEAGLLEIVSSMLDDLGVNVLQAIHPNDALMLQDEHHGDIDLVLTDIMMPEMNGVHMASMMQSIDERLKVAYMSGFAGRGKATQVEIPQGAPFLPKPFSYEDLAHCVYETLVNQPLVNVTAKGGSYEGRANV